MKVGRKKIAERPGIEKPLGEGHQAQVDSGERKVLQQEEKGEHRGEEAERAIITG